MEKILILDFAGNRAQTVARRVRDLKVYSEILPNNTPAETIAEMGYKGIIQIGGSGNNPPDVPVLDFEDQSEKVLSEFLFNVCGCEGNWRIETFVENSIKSLREKIGERTVLLALSGGVDSSVVALLLHRAIGNQLRCIFVDHGLLRKYEAAEVMELFLEKYQMNIKMTDASGRFLDKLAGVTDPEKKRKIIGEEFIRVFEDEAKKIGKVDFLAQGTIYPDIVESGIGAELVKSHHNVGGLPDCVDFDEIIEPLRDLFKDEVRKAGIVLGMPEKLVWRQPFPGPGLAVRVLGELTRERLDLLRDVDFIFRSEVMNAGLHREADQYFAVLTDICSVGVKDDKRTYLPMVALRAVNTKDFMTAKLCRLPYDLLERVSGRITAETPVGRVVYDITNKPPATIEWE